MKPIEDRRKLSNLTIDPKAQLRFVKPFIILMLVAFLVINTIFWQILALRGEAGDAANTALFAALSGLMSQIVFISSLGMILLGILSLVFWIVYSHRIFGPVVSLRRHITSLLEGKYDSRVKLRKNDELKDLADDLNKLAESLQSRLKV